MSSFAPAQRAGVGLLIGIAGCSGSGKTLSALRVARGLAGGDDGKIAFIDTEAGRALHYAPSPGEAPTAATFGFAHAPLAAPFSPQRYLDLIEEADRAGFAVIVIDSFSHVWAGDGGLQDWHDEEVEAAIERARKRHEQNGGRFPFDAEREGEKASVGAWKAPKVAHKRLVNRLLQCRAHLVICLRAEDKLRMETKEEEGRNGRTYTKTTITPAEKLPPSERWAPVCEKRLPYELITSLVLSPDAPGVPIPLKLQAQHKPFVPLDRPLDERVGEQLAAWARGAKPAGMTPAAHMNRTAAPADDVSSAAQDPGARASPPTQPMAPGSAPDLVQWDGTALDPDDPQRLDLFPGADQAAWKAAGVALRACLAGASTHGLAATWWELNELQFRGRSPALANWIAEALPADLNGAPTDQLEPAFSQAGAGA